MKAINGDELIKTLQSEKDKARHTAERLAKKMPQLAGAEDNFSIELIRANQSWNDFQKAILLANGLPKVELVTCKECRYNPTVARRYDDDEFETFMWCYWMAGSSGGNFCSLGKQKGEEKCGEK